MYNKTKEKWYGAWVAHISVCKLFGLHGWHHGIKDILRCDSCSPCQPPSQMFARKILPARNSWVADDLCCCLSISFEQKQEGMLHSSFVFHLQDTLPCFFTSLIYDVIWYYIKVLVCRKEKWYGAGVAHISYVAGSAPILKMRQDTNAPIMKPASNKCGIHIVWVYAI